MFLTEYWREKNWKYFRDILTRLWNTECPKFLSSHETKWRSILDFIGMIPNCHTVYKKWQKTCVGGDGLGGYRGNQGRLKRDCQRCQGWVSPCAYARTLRYCSGWSGPCQTSGWYCRKWTMLSLFLAASPPWYQPSLPTQTKKKYFDIVSLLGIFVILPSTLTILTLIVSVVE